MKYPNLVYIFSLAAHGKGISGGDRIFIELAKRWSKLFKIRIFVWEEGFRMCKSQNLKSPNILFNISKLAYWRKLGFLVNYAVRIVEGTRLGFLLDLNNDSKIVIYSASEFWMDSFPAFILKLRYPKIIWLAAWFQTAPNPLKGYSEDQKTERYRLSALLYWLVQLPIKPMISRFADYIMINNEEERRVFKRHDSENKLIVVLGAVDTENIDKWAKKFKKSPKIYDAIFQGRFHPQKGVVELIHIWRRVADKKPDAVLAMIGDGPLMEDVKNNIKKLNLGKNVKLFGYLFDGPNKYRIFAQSKLVVHPAFYDSGGMASAEAMAFGLPCVGFNLKSYQSYYPKGMIRVETGDKEEFANTILELLENLNLRQKMAQDAESMIKRSWSWDLRAKSVLDRIN